MTREDIADVCKVSAEEVACRNCERFNAEGEVWCNGFNVETSLDNYCAWFDRRGNGKTHRRNISGAANQDQTQMA